MNAGTLFHDIIIEAPFVERNQDFGSQSEVWKPIIKTKADVQFDNGTKELDNDEVFYAWNMTFKIRYYHKIKETMRIIWKDQKYRILSILPDRIKQVQIIKTELINE